MATGMARQTTLLRQREEQIKAKIADAERQAREFRERLHELTGQRKAIERSLDRKSRDRRLYQIGGLALLVNIDSMEKDALLGAFMWVAQQATDMATLEQWKAAGAALHARQGKDNVKSAAAQGLKTKT